MNESALASRIEFRVACVPIAQPRQKQAMIAGHMHNYTPTKHPVNAFKATMRMGFSAVYDGPPLEGPVSLEATFIMPRPLNLHWKTRPMPRVPHDKKPDSDNLVKSLKDALKGLAYRDDSQVADLRVRKFVAAGDEQPHVAVVITLLAGV